MCGEGSFDEFVEKAFSPETWGLNTNESCKATFLFRILHKLPQPWRTPEAEPASVYPHCARLRRCKGVLRAHLGAASPSAAPRGPPSLSKETDSVHHCYNICFLKCTEPTEGRSPRGHLRTACGVISQMGLRFLPAGSASFLEHDPTPLAWSAIQEARTSAVKGAKQKTLVFSAFLMM